MPNSTTGGGNSTLKNDNKMWNYLFTLDLLQYFDIEDITLKKPAICRSSKYLLTIQNLV